MLNRVILMGRLTRDPELRRTGSGIAVTSMRIAVETSYKDKNSNERKTIFLDLVAWRQTAEYAAKYFTKGRMVVVEGGLDVRDWTDKNNNKRQNTEIVVENLYFADSRKDGSQQNDGQQNGGQQNGGYMPPVGNNGYPGESATPQPNDGAPNAGAYGNYGGYGGFGGYGDYGIPAGEDFSAYGGGMDSRF